MTPRRVNETEDDESKQQRDKNTGTEHQRQQTGKKRRRRNTQDEDINNNTPKRCVRRCFQPLCVPPATNSPHSGAGAALGPQDVVKRALPQKAGASAPVALAAAATAAAATAATAAASTTSKVATTNGPSPGVLCDHFTIAAPNVSVNNVGCGTPLKASGARQAAILARPHAVPTSPTLTFGRDEADSGNLFERCFPIAAPDLSLSAWYGKGEE